MFRRLGLLLCGLGLTLLLWIAVTLVWGDPITSLYTGHEQHVLGERLAVVEHNWPTGRRVRAYEAKLEAGQPIGRIVIPRLHLNMVVVEGTSEAQLAKGPGHYNAASGRATRLPGLGGVIAIAGHRTTFLHPFLHINDLKPGDAIKLVMPYGTFTYRMTSNKVVLPTDLSILKLQRYEELVLTACHPLYSASHRFVVFARLRASSYRASG